MKQSIRSTCRSKLPPKNEVEALIYANLGLVPFVCMKLGYKDNDDAFQEGAQGLSDAAQHFDPKRGVKFGTFAAWCIKRRIQNWARWMSADKRQLPEADHAVVMKRKYDSPMLRRGIATLDELHVDRHCYQDQSDARLQVEDLLRRASPKDRHILTLLLKHDCNIKAVTDATRIAWDTIQRAIKRTREAGE